jgi:dihydropteroate synthase
MNSKTKIMGVLNLTPDSFYDGGIYKNTKEVLDTISLFLNEGADIIDIGAYSSRPNAEHISTEEELSRLIPILKEIKTNYPKTIISIDTFRSEVARQSILEGAQIINDISGGTIDNLMFQTIAEHKVSYILMHMQGTPQTMQVDPTYHDITKQIMRFFQKKLAELHNLGVNDVILDVGFGFGKTIDQNYELLNNLSVFKTLEKPLLVGVSRKSMLYKILGTTPEKALNATSIVNTIALLNGANILRVHDVKEAKEVVTIVKQYKDNS